MPMTQLPLDPQRLAGKRVTHYVFGKGSVTRVSKDTITVSFGKTERMFEYPAAFGEYLTVEDKRLQKVLPVCTKAPPPPKPPAKGNRRGFVHDEYDTATLADDIGCKLKICY